MSDTKPRARLALGTDLDLSLALDEEGHFVFSYTNGRTGQADASDAGPVQCVAVARFVEQLLELLEQHDTLGMANYERARVREATTVTSPAEAAAATAAFAKRTGLPTWSCGVCGGSCVKVLSGHETTMGVLPVDGHLHDTNRKYAEIICEQGHPTSVILRHHCPKPGCTWHFPTPGDVDRLNLQRHQVLDGLPTLP